MDLDEKVSILENIESILPVLLSQYHGFYTSGHDCMLRSICEVAKTPSHDNGVMGDIVNLLLSPMQLDDRLREEEFRNSDSDYVKAQLSGKLRGDCSQYHQGCQIPMFEVSIVQKL